jgi:hypothetical protein
MAMMISPNTVAPRTSRVASWTTCIRSAAVSGDRRGALASASRRTAFSTTITAPSTIRPKSIAPRLMRLPEAPVAFITITANSIASGMVVATTMPGAQVAEQQQQHEDDEAGALEQVDGDGADRAVDEQGAVVEGSTRTPGGRVGSSSASLSLIPG